MTQSLTRVNDLQGRMVSPSGLASAHRKVSRHAVWLLMDVRGQAGKHEHIQVHLQTHDRTYACQAKAKLPGMAPRTP